MRRVKLKFFALSSLFLLILAGLPSRAGADIFYSASNYENGSAGVITKSVSGYSVNKDRVVNLGGDATGFAFLNGSGKQRAMIREYHYGANDTVYVWDPSNWAAPLINRNDWGSNIHAVAASGNNLYIATYESYASASSAQDSGEIIQVDLTDNLVKKRYRYPAFTGDSGMLSTPHGEALFAYGGKIYALFGVSYNGVAEYEPTEIVEFDSSLTRLRSVKLKDGAGNIGRNAMRAAVYGGRLYVACIGGYQGPNSWGDLWEVSLPNMSARQVLAGRDMPYELPGGGQAAVGMYGVQFASDGTAFLMTGSYSSGYDFRARIFRTTASALSAGDKGTLIADYAPVAGSTDNKGYSWDILWDEASQTLWCMTGRNLEARDKSGSLVRSFTPAELGDNIYSVSLLNGGAGQDTSTDPGGDSGTDPDGTDPGGQPAAPSAPQPVTDLNELTSEELPAESFNLVDGEYVMKESFAMSQAEKVLDGVTEANPLPAFKAPAASGGGLVSVSFTVKGSGLLARTAREINLIKVRKSGRPLLFRHNTAGNTDGTFRVLSGGTVHSGALSSGTTYALELCLKDGGQFDLDGNANASVLDPAALVRTSSTGGDNTGTEEPGDVPAGSSGGGGCATGAAGLAALGIAFALMRRSSQRRDCGK